MTEHTFYNTAELELPEALVDTLNDVEIGLPARVILYNDEDHTFEEVIGQLMIATGCSLSQAEALTHEVHSRGKAQVFDGAMNSCLRVSSVLEEISLNTRVEF